MEELIQKSVVRRDGKQKTFRAGDKITIKTYLNGVRPSDYCGEATWELGVRIVENGKIGWRAVSYDAKLDDTYDTFIPERDLRGWKEIDSEPAQGNTYYNFVYWE
jgi:hypothetical protein